LAAEKVRYFVELGPGRLGVAGPLVEYLEVAWNGVDVGHGDPL
jgi:hypothetical protein